MSGTASKPPGLTAPLPLQQPAAQDQHDQGRAYLSKLTVVRGVAAGRDAMPCLELSSGQGCTAHWQSLQACIIQRQATQLHTAEPAG